MRFDLHIHTKYSKCSNLEPRLILKAAKKLNLGGIGIVDHHSLKGAIATHKLNKDKNFKVIKGIEFYTEYCHLIGLDLNEEIKEKTFPEIIDKIKQQGALAIVAHPCAPFRGRLKIDINKIKKNINAIESFNSRALLPWENKASKNMAKKANLPETAGSDAHFNFEIGSAYTKFEGSLRDAIKKSRTTTCGSTNPLRSFYAMSLSKAIKVFK